MKLLLVSDLHYALKQFDWIASVASDFDVVIIAGDHLDISGQLDGTLITICPWWDGPRMKASVQAQLERDAARPKDRWFWVYHAPPDASPTSWGGSRHYGDTDVVGWIQTHRPDAVFCGHIHQAPFKRGGSWIDQIGSTWVFNSGQQIGPTPAHVMVDTEAYEAAWFSLAGAELARLNAPLQRPVPDLTAMPAWLARA